MADGKIFDREFYPPGLEQAHTLLTPEELLHFFGVSDPDKVDHDSYSIVQMINTVHAEKEKAKRSGEPEPDAAYSLDAFGNNYNLKLKRNTDLIASNAKLVIKDGNHTYTERVTNSSYPVEWLLAEEDDGWGYNEYDGSGDEDNSAMTECDNFIVRSSFAEISAVFSDCYEVDEEDGFGEESLENHYIQRRRKQTFRDLTGIVFDNQNKETFEIYTVPQRIREMIINFRDDFNKSMNYSLTTPAEDVHHVLVKRATFPETGKEHFDNHRISKRSEHHTAKRSGATGRSSDKFVETALFMDPEAYAMYKDYFTQAGVSDVTKRIINLMLAFMNSIQAIYHFESLGTKVTFSIVNLEIQKTTKFDNHGGDRGPLLTSFCEYQGDKNPGDDTDPDHWDIGLLVSGVDFWATSGGRKSYLTMGLATVTGICTKKYGCVIGEMGVRDHNEKPYPSTGFTSVYVMAHEIGHNLGMSHDSSGNVCSSNGYVMSPSRGTKGECVWSTCSRDHMDKLDLECLEDTPAAMPDGKDHNIYGDNPGQDESWDGDRQCQMLMFTNDAHMDHTESNMKDICYSMKCRSPGRRGYYRAGPALEGTPCGRDLICHQGECVKNTISPGVTNTANWSEWSGTGTCESGCIPRSQGFIKKTRICNKKSPVTINSICPGSTTEVTLCDEPTCSGYTTAKDYAKTMCQKFINADSRLASKIKAHGYQPSHVPDRGDIACTIHCKKPTGGWYAPTLELNDRTDVDVYFPDGTFCHSEGGTDYYCRKHQCQSSARGSRADNIPDLLISQNVRPDGKLASMEAYFSLNEEGEPESNNFQSADNNEAPEEEWEVLDYVEN